MRGGGGGRENEKGGGETGQEVITPDCPLPHCSPTWVGLDHEGRGRVMKLWGRRQESGIDISVGRLRYLSDDTRY